MVRSFCSQHSSHITCVTLHSMHTLLYLCEKNIRQYFIDRLLLAFHFSKPFSLPFSGEVDLAMTVTDAFMVGKANGRKVQLLGTFVESPLVWAVSSSTSIEQAHVLTISDLLSAEKFGEKERN